jgi:hypothetical protein
LQQGLICVRRRWLYLDDAMTNKSMLLTQSETSEFLRLSERTLEAGALAVAVRHSLSWVAGCSIASLICWNGSPRTLCTRPARCADPNPTTENQSND